MKHFSKEEHKINEAITEKVSLNIRKLMKRAKIQQMDLARKTGLTQGHVCYICNGIRPVSLEGLRRIALALEVPVTKLIPKSL